MGYDFKPLSPATRPFPKMSDGAGSTPISSIVIKSDIQEFCFGIIAAALAFITLSVVPIR
jgi:hypothetical protein